MMYYILVSMLILCCSRTTPPGANQQPKVPKVQKANCDKPIKQGIRGKLIYVEGNMMPGPGVTLPEGKPVSRLVGIFEPTTPEQTETDGMFYQKVKTKLVRRVISDKNGCFALSLPPGRYTLLVWEEGAWFGNTFHDDMVINPVLVREGEVTQTEIKINHRAAY